jgi:hypothetical protein
MQEAECCRPLCSRPRGRTFGATWVTSGATALLGHQLRVTLQVALGALALAFGGAHALASVPELRHDARLLVLSERTGDLPHHDAGGVAGVREVVAGRGQYPNATFD